MQDFHAEDGATNASGLVSDPQVILFVEFQTQVRSQFYCRRRQSPSPIGRDYIGIRKP